MSCCARHDRLDLMLTTVQYLDHWCGTPTMPDGEPRYCCRSCVSLVAPLQVRPEWVANPTLMSYLTPDERQAVNVAALGLGPMRVDLSFIGEQP